MQDCIYLILSVLCNFEMKKYSRKHSRKYIAENYVGLCIDLLLSGLPTLTLVKLVDGDRKTGNPSEKGGDSYWSIEGGEGARLPKALAPRGV